MQRPAVHDRGECGAVVGVFFGYNLFSLVQVFFEMGVFVLAADGFYIVVALYGHDDVVLAQQPFIVRTAEDGFFFLLHIVCMDLPPEIPPIMAQSDILALQVLPGPVQPGELAEVGVLVEMLFPVSSVVNPSGAFPAAPTWRGR